MTAHLFGMTPEALHAHLVGAGVDATLQQARRVCAHVISRGEPLDTLPRLRRDVRAAITELTSDEPLTIVERAPDRDGFVKYLLRSPDGALSEAVRIPLAKPGRYTVCLSSQVGCAMGCTFCATGRLGLSRDLQPWEMVAAMVAVRAELPDGERISGAVFMGQGEPLHNYDAVITAAQVLSHPNGGRIAAKAISISTVGLVAQIRRYTREGHRYRLIVSLTSAVASRRRTLLPIAGRTPLSELAEALREHAAARGVITLAWVLMGGVNDGADEIAALRDLLDGAAVRINLIDVNAIDDDFRRCTDAERERFRDMLEWPMVRRYSGGAGRHAACGMLRNAQQ